MCKNRCCKLRCHADIDMEQIERYVTDFKMSLMLCGVVFYGMLRDSSVSSYQSKLYASMYVVSTLTSMVRCHFARLRCGRCGGDCIFGPPWSAGLWDEILRGITLGTPSNIVSARSRGIYRFSFAYRYVRF
jgi:hypothetical protein